MNLCEISPVILPVTQTQFTAPSAHLNIRIQDICDAITFTGTSQEKHGFSAGPVLKSHNTEASDSSKMALDSSVLMSECLP